MEELTYMFLGPPDDCDDHLEEVSVATGSSRHDEDSHGDSSTSHEDDAAAVPPAATATPPPASDAPRKHKHRGIRGFLSKANLQDQLLDKLFQQVIPIDSFVGEDLDPESPGHEDGDSVHGDDDEDFDDDDDEPAKPVKPAFSVAIMSTNFRRFNARIGVVFRFQKRVDRLLAWRHPSHTLAFLGVYTLVCLDPYLLTMLPPAVFLLAVLIPAFIARHPGTDGAHGVAGAHAAHGIAGTATPGGTVTVGHGSTPDYAQYARGPPLAPPRTIKPVKELSRDFFRNMGDLQNCMEDFSVAHDSVVQLVVPATNFSDEASSSALFVVLCAAASLLSVAAHRLPWRALFLLGGWAVVGSGHPAAARALRMWRRQRRRTKGTSGATTDSVSLLDEDEYTSFWKAWVASDILLDEAPETREVEIFELQRRSAAAAAEWEPWLFSPSPYDPMSQPRLGHSRFARPSGSRFFEDVLPPPGWEWSEKKWALDLWSRDWVEERIITGVEVETEGERWVYDIYSEQEQQQQAAAAEAEATRAGFGFGLGDSDFDTDHTALRPPPSERPLRQTAGPGWQEGEEGEEGMGRRGEWRRRRWVRTVKRKKILETV